MPSKYNPDARPQLLVTAVYSSQFNAKVFEDWVLMVANGLIDRPLEIEKLIKTKRRKEYIFVYVKLNKYWITQMTTILNDDGNYHPIKSGLATCSWFYNGKKHVIADHTGSDHGKKKK